MSIGKLLNNKYVLTGMFGLYVAFVAYFLNVAFVAVAWQLKNELSLGDLLMIVQVLSIVIAYVAAKVIFEFWKGRFRFKLALGLIVLMVAYFLLDAVHMLLS